MEISLNGINLIKEVEGCRLTAYKDSVGVWTIGYGSTLNVHEGMVISEAVAEQMLQEELSWVEDTLNKSKIPLTQNQFDALASFVYNVGSGAWDKSMLKKVIKNKASDNQVEKQWMRWVYAGGKRLKGLFNRRKKELELYLKK